MLPQQYRRLYGCDSAASLAQINLSGCLIIESLMKLLIIVKPKVFLEPCASIEHGLMLFDEDLLILHSAPESFHKDIVQRPTSSIPTNMHHCLFEPLNILLARKLHSMIRLRDRWRSRSQSRFQRFQTGARFQSHRQLRGQDIATKPIQKSDQIQGYAAGRNRNSEEERSHSG
jgi:hypothetical protein